MKVFIRFSDIFKVIVKVPDVLGMWSAFWLYDDGVGK